MAFVHLHVHSEYSALDGMIRVNEAFGIARDMGQTALAITDHGNLSAAWTAQQQAERAGVKFIAGIEAYLAIGSRFEQYKLWVPADDNSADEDSERSEDKKDGEQRDGMKARPYMHLTVLARNAAGWQNLVRLNNKAQESIWHKPRIDFDLLAEHNEGLIVLTGCLGGPVLGPLSRQAHWLRAADKLTAEDGEKRAKAWIEAQHTELAKQARENGVTYSAQVWEQSEVDDLADRLLQERKVELLGYADQEYRAARTNLQAIIDAVGLENTYVEVMDHGIEDESTVLPAVVELAREFDVGIVATNDAHHSHEAGAEAHSAWLLVQSKSTFDNPKFQFHGHGFWMRSEDEMRALRPEPWWQEACDTSAAIAERCENRVLPTPRNLMPQFETPDGFASNRDFLFHLLREGAATIFGGIDPELQERVMSEMGVIESAGMVDYFLVVHDLISWARSTRPSRPGGPDKKPILVGPGRGSAGGSMVAFLLGITQINPIRYGLLFERFYETGRAEPPDIDIDFPQGRRQEVIQYLRDRWGAENVASIGSVTVERTKRAINDAARVIGASPSGRAMNALVPTVEAKPMPIRDLLDPNQPASAEYRRLYEKDDIVRRVHAIAETFEEVAAGYGIHASGIIVSAEPLEDLVPLRKAKGAWVLQWTGPEAEQFGLLKVDVLGLRNLDIIERAAQYIENTTGEFVDPLHLPDPDFPEPGRDADRVALAWKLIAEGRTAGIFQMESAKMTELAMQVAPRRLEEESAVVALYRPGPMSANMHTTYARRKRGEEATDYRVFTTDPREQAELQKVLGETFAVWVYQEQLMQLGTVIAGFDAAERSQLRKAVSKKKADVMAAVGEKFRAGAVREFVDDQGNVTSIAFSAQTADTIWDAMLGSASYLFNKAHSATYGYLAYMTAFYKANWPAAYAAANLSVTDNDAKRLQVLSTLQGDGIEVLPPDVNSTSAYTVPEGDAAIRFGISEVKELGSVGELIAAERVAGGEYASLRDMVIRVHKPDDSGSAVSSAHLKALINSGAADRFGPRLGHMTIAGAIPAKEIPVPDMEWGVLERSARQRQSLLTPLGEHPLVSLHSQVAQVRLPSLLGRKELEVKPTGISRIPDVDGEIISVLGVLANWSERAYSKGRLANITLEGSTSSINGTIWDNALTEIKESGAVPNVGEIVIVKARVRFNVIAADPDDPDSEETSVKELSVMAVRGVQVVDHRFGGLPSMTFPRLDLTRGPAYDAPGTISLPEPELEMTTAPSGPAPASSTAGGNFDGPMIFDTTLDGVAAAPAPVAVMAPPAPAPAPMVAPAPAVALPGIGELVSAGQLVEADRAQGGSGLVNLQGTRPSPTVTTTAPVTTGVREPLPAGEWGVVILAEPSAQVAAPHGPYRHKRDTGYALLTANDDFEMDAEMYNTALADTIDAAVEASGLSGAMYVLMSRGGQPVFQFEVGG